MAITLIELPLYNEPDYSYNISLERVSYNFRFYYNERMQSWIFDFRFSNNDPIILGQSLTPQFPLYIDYLSTLSGFFWLEPIGKLQNETITNPYELFKYYKLYYVYDEVIDA